MWVAATVWLLPDPLLPAREEAVARCFPGQVAPAAKRGNGGLLGLTRARQRAVREALMKRSNYGEAVGLTGREMAVLHGIAQGLTDQGIADELNLSIHTINMNAEE